MLNIHKIFEICFSPLRVLWVFFNLNQMPGSLSSAQYLSYPWNQSFESFFQLRSLTPTAITGITLLSISSSFLVLLSIPGITYIFSQRYLTKRRKIEKFFINLQFFLNNRIVFIHMVNSLAVK